MLKTFRIWQLEHRFHRLLELFNPYRGWLVVKLFGLDLVVMSGSLAGRYIFLVPDSFSRYIGDIGVVDSYYFLDAMPEIEIFPTPTGLNNDSPW